MDIRKVQMTGGSSFIVTLPKDWVDAIGLKKNDPLRVTQLSDGSLSISITNTEVTIERMTKRINVDGINDNDFLFRLLVGAYMSGYNMIEVFSSSRLSNAVLDIVTKITQTAIGLEIIEETDNSITMKDLVDPSEMKIKKTIERMKILVRNMLADIVSSLRKNDIESIMDIATRDSDVDRLEWLIARQMSMSQKDFSVAKRMNLDQGQITSCYTIGRIIERIGDHTVSIAMNAGKLGKHGITNELKNDVCNMCERVTEIFVRSLNVVFGDDPNKANDCIEDAKAAGEESKKINKHLIGKEYDDALSIGMLSGSLRRICEYSMDIAELAINSLMNIPDKNETEKRRK